MSHQLGTVGTWSKPRGRQPELCEMACLELRYKCHDEANTGHWPCLLTLSCCCPLQQQSHTDNWQTNGLCNSKLAEDTYKLSSDSLHHVHGWCDTYRWAVWCECAPICWRHADLRQLSPTPVSVTLSWIWRIWMSNQLGAGQVPVVFNLMQTRQSSCGVLHLVAVVADINFLMNRCWLALSPWCQSTPFATLESIWTQTCRWTHI